MAFEEPSKTNQSLLSDLSARVKTYSLIQWCGMPYNVSFRGFYLLKNR
jgi:hypothetical protein